MSEGSKEHKMSNTIWIHDSGHIEIQHAFLPLIQKLKEKGITLEDVSLPKKDEKK